MEIRLQKYLADCGIASRRAAEAMIRGGRVAVNGVTVTEMGVKVSETDTVALDGRPVGKGAGYVYIMLNKPKGYITTSHDQFGRPSALDLVKAEGARLFAVGRLDYGTTGLLLLTNDGDLAYRLTHPKHSIEKSYMARVRGVLYDGDLKALSSGVYIETDRGERVRTAPARLEVIGVEEGKTNVRVTITEGRNRQVRRMFEAVGHTVISLRRESVGGLTLGGLKEGEHRRLTDREVERLKSL